MRTRIVNEATVAEELTSHLEKTINIKRDILTYEIKFVDEIPIDKTGKFSAVVSEVQKGF